MTQLDIYKNAYIGALETYTSLKALKDANDIEERLEKAAREFDEIRDLLFAEIEKITGPLS